MHTHKRDCVRVVACKGDHGGAVDISGDHQVRASMQGKPKRVGRRSNWNKIGKHGHAYETTPEPSTPNVVDIT